MEEPIPITWLNDFIFCPASIYFHNLYGSADRLSHQETSQINGSHAHEAIDNGGYSTRSDILSGSFVFCEKYSLVGKIDIFDSSRGLLVERKKKIKTVFPGYIYQLYGQYFALTEMGFRVNSLVLRSLDDNKRYPVPRPDESPELLSGFESVVSAIQSFDLTSFVQTNREKCARCIYEPLCDRSLTETECPS